MMDWRKTITNTINFKPISKKINKDLSVNVNVSDYDVGDFSPCSNSFELILMIV